MAVSRNLPQPDLPASVASFLASHLPGVGRISVGLSGGCDSVVLLHVLRGLLPEREIDAVHVHHGLSPNADLWAAFCEDYCHRLGVPLFVARVAVARDSADGLEAAARAARYAALARLAGPVLMLAHHRDDQAETVLLNLLRGAGPAGLAAMRPMRPWVNGTLLRPLLACGRTQVEAYAQAEGLVWIEDDSNGDSRHARNFLRLELMPLIGRRFPAVSERLVSTAGLCRESEELLAQLAEIDWAMAAEGDALNLRALRNLPEMRARNLLRYRLRCLGWQVPGQARLGEFVRQLREAGPDRHPELRLPDGVMRAGRGVLRWLSEK